MADMNKRHHRLIADAIKEAVVALEHCPAIQRQLKEGGDMKIVQRWIIKTMAEKMAEKLQYSHDNFDPNVFVQEVQRNFEGRKL